MMDPVKKFGQIQINHRLITSFQVACCFRNGGVSSAMRAEPVRMTAVRDQADFA